MTTFRKSLFVAAALAAFATSASANPLSLFASGLSGAYHHDDVVTDGSEDRAEQPARFKRQIVDYHSNEAPGTIVIDTPNTYLYFVLGSGKALRYGIGVGREGFTWSGTQTISRMAEWPDWHPPAEMLERQPYLPRFMAGGPGNPLGARAMYLGGTVYRIHGTNAPQTIGGRVSSGCIRLTNDDVADLYSRVKLGTKVTVLPIERHADAGGPSLH